MILIKIMNKIININFYLIGLAFRSLEIIYLSWIMPCKCNDKTLFYEELLASYIGILTLANILFLVIFFEVSVRSDEF
jgi:hypothetical protein